jgi:hypothetical protein
MRRIWKRFNHWYGLLRRAVWPLFAIPVAILLDLFSIRDEFLPPAVAARLKMPEWLPPFPWYLWTILLLVLILIALLEGAYWEHLDHVEAFAASNDPLRLREIEAQEAHTRAVQRQADALEHQNRDNDPIVKMVRAQQEQQFLPPVFGFEVGEQEPFFTTGGSALGNIKRTFKIKLSNVHPHKTARNCRVQVVKINPPSGYGLGPWPLKEVESLSSGDHVFIPLATYNEARNREQWDCSDSFFTTYLGSPGHPAFDIKETYIFTLRATADDCPMKEFNCKLRVDEHGRFRIEKI